MATKPSKFSSIFQPDEEPAGEETPAQVIVPAIEPEPAPLATPEPDAPEKGSVSNRRSSQRTTGKKSDKENYRQVTAYVRRDLYRDVTEALHDEVKGQDIKRKEFSELVDELLEQWRRDRTSHHEQIT